MKNIVKKVRWAVITAAAGTALAIALAACGNNMLDMVTEQAGWDAPEKTPGNEGEIPPPDPNVTIISSDTTFDEPYTIEAGKTLRIAAGATLTLNAALENLGTLDIQGRVTVTPPGTIDNNNTVTVGNYAWMTLEGPSGTPPDPPTLLTNDGTLTVNGTLRVQNNAKAVSGVGATVNVGKNGFITTRWPDYATFKLLFDGDISQMTRPLDKAVTLNVEAGGTIEHWTMNKNPDWIGNDKNYSVQLADGAQFQRVSYYPVDGLSLKAKVTVSGGGAVTLNHGPSMSGGANPNMGGQLANADTFTVEGPTMLIIPDTHTEAAPFVIGDGSDIFGKPAELTIKSGARMVVNGWLKTNSATTPANRGTITNSGTIIVSGGYTNAGVTTSVGTISVSGTYTNAGVTTSAGTISVNGTVKVSAGGVLDTSACTAPTPITGTGKIAVEAGGIYAGNTHGISGSGSIVFASGAKGYTGAADPLNAYAPVKEDDFFVGSGRDLCGVTLATDAELALLANGYNLKAAGGTSLNASFNISAGTTFTIESGTFIVDDGRQGAKLALSYTQGSGPSGYIKVMPGATLAVMDTGEFGGLIGSEDNIEVDPTQLELTVSASSDPDTATGADVSTTTVTTASPGTGGALAALGKTLFTLPAGDVNMVTGTPAGTAATGQITAGAGTILTFTRKAN